MFAFFVDRSISFSGRSHDFFLEAKARALEDVVRRYVGAAESVRALRPSFSEHDIEARAAARHADVTMTLNTYAHALPDAQLDAASKLNAVLAG